MKRYCLFVLMFASGGFLRGETAPEQEAYWWQDELRTAAFALNRARAGAVSAWPRLTVCAGTGTLPLPRASGPVTPDGILAEVAWERATRFPIGPIFLPWRDGPILLQVRACRDEKTAYLAMEAGKDLSGYGSLSSAGELFSIGGRAFRIGERGEIAGGAVGSGEKGQVIELAVSLPKGTLSWQKPFPRIVSRFSPSSSGMTSTPG